MMYMQERQIQSQLSEALEAAMQQQAAVEHHKRQRALIDALAAAEATAAHRLKVGDRA